MNDLEPWQIWAVTAVLVCVIMGTTAARVRPLIPGEASAQAAVVPSDERSTTVATNSPDAAADQYEASPSYIPNRSFSGGGYSGFQASSNAPLTNLLYGFAGSSSGRGEYYQEPITDVAQQILGEQSSRADMVATNEDQISDYGISPILNSDADLSTATGLVFTDLYDGPPEPDGSNGISYAAIGDTLATIAVGDIIASGDTSTPTDARVIDISVQNALINLANGSASNENVALVEALDRVGELGEASIELDGLDANPAQSMAMSGELNDQLGDEDEALDSWRAQEVRGEGLIRLQAAVQQAAVAQYTVTMGRMNLRVNGTQFSVEPDE